MTIENNNNISLLYRDSPQGLSKSLGSLLMLLLFMMKNMVMQTKSHASHFTCITSFSSFLFRSTRST